MCSLIHCNNFCHENHIGICEKKNIALHLKHIFLDFTCWLMYDSKDFLEFQILLELEGQHSLSS
jgi:hypothetical protein